MKITTFGTRGSLPVSGPAFIRYGGNTTCVQVESPCLPPAMALCVDAGSGFLPFSSKNLASGKTEWVVLQTHYHHDHTQGMLVAPIIYQRSNKLSIFGPVEAGMGPREVYGQLMCPPLHPVALASREEGVDFVRITDPLSQVLIIHQQGGVLSEKSETVAQSRAAGGYAHFSGGPQLISECLIVSMHFTDHPDTTLAYRFDELPTGKSFVMVTDEEVRESVPESFRRFLSGVTLLIADAQYGAPLYDSGVKSGFGHGTPTYVMALAKMCGVGRLGLTHHDPTSSDQDIDALVAEAESTDPDRAVSCFACGDTLEIDL